MYKKKLKKIDSACVPLMADEIRLFMVIKNESVRLPYFFKYYSGIGVNRFFVIDNHSTDNSKSFLLSQKNTHVFEISDDYISNNSGHYWISELLGIYGKGCWCLVIDADEIFIYPHYENISLPLLCQFLDGEGSTALQTFLLDMYSDKPIRLTRYRKGIDPLSICYYFDKGGYYKDRKPLSDWSGLTICKGGTRKRIFNVSTCLNKVSLFKSISGASLSQGQHFISNSTISKIEGVTLHFKYMHDFTQRIPKQSGKNTHSSDGVTQQVLFEIKAYKEKITKNPNLNLYYRHSIRYQNSDELVRAKIMKTYKKFEGFVKTQKNNEHTMYSAI